MQRFRHSIRLRLTLWYAGVLAFALAVFAASVYIFVVRSLQTDVDQALSSYGRQVQTTASKHVQGTKLAVNHLPLPTSSPREPVLALLIMNIHGQERKVVHGKVVLGPQQLRISLRSGRPSCGTLPVGRGAALAKNAQFRFCTQLVYHRGKPVGGIEVVESLAGINSALDRLRLALLLGAPLVLLLACTGGWVLAGRALEPVNRITEMARSITATDLSRRIDLQRHDELGRLAGTFDQMIGRLERAFQEQRRLTADVSHELRSPLTILEGQTSLALRRSRSPEEYRQVLQSIQDEVERMSSMLNQLLMLARADAGQEPIKYERISLRSVVEPVVDAMQPLAEDRGVVLVSRGHHDVWVEGDDGRLRQLLLNLIDNALRYTPRGGRIEVALDSKGGHPRLEVSDSGSGIDPNDLPHIFQRFYRADRARQRITGHAGLGLAIVKWIVDAHGADVSVRSAPGQGSAFTVIFGSVTASGGQ